MKKAINALIAIAVLGMLTAAYAVCYLEQVVLCFKAGDEINSTSSLTVGACTSFTAHIFANENAYRIDTYSVNRGGNSQSAFSSGSMCDTEDNVSQEMGTGGSGGSFHVWVLNSCTGATMIDLNGNDGVAYTVASHYANHGNNCN